MTHRLLFVALPYVALALLACVCPAGGDAAGEASPVAGPQVAAPVGDSAANESATVLSRGTWGGGVVESETPTRPVAVVSTRGMLLRVVLGLGLVMGILGAVLFLYKKASRGGPGFRGDAIQVLAQKGLSQRAGLAVVRVAGETLLLGVTQNQVTNLTRIGGTPPADSDAAPRHQTIAEDAAAIDALIGARDQPDEKQDFERTLAGEIKRVRENLWTSLKRVDL